MAVGFAIALKGKVVTFKELLPGRIYRCGIVPVILVELVKITNVCV
jgi:hypothetical protein